MKDAPSSPNAARHPFHPLFTHFPMALMGIAPVWDLVGLLRPEPVWWQLSFWCMVAGLVAAVPALFTGFMDFVAIAEGHPAQRVANHHLVWVLSAIGVFTINLFVRGGSQPPVGPYRLTAFLLSVAGLALLVIGGWHGGELVYAHGIGQQRPVGEGRSSAAQ